MSSPLKPPTEKCYLYGESSINVLHPEMYETEITVKRMPFEVRKVEGRRIPTQRQFEEQCWKAAAKVLRGRYKKVVQCKTFKEAEALARTFHKGEWADVTHVTDDGFVFQRYFVLVRK